jgi:hypothetical protein
MPVRQIGSRRMQLLTDGILEGPTRSVPLRLRPLQAETQFFSHRGQPLSLACLGDFASQRAATLINPRDGAIRENQIATTGLEGIEILTDAEVELRAELARVDSFQTLKDVEAIVRDSVWMRPSLLVDAGEACRVKYLRDEHLIGFGQLFTRRRRARTATAQPQRDGGPDQAREYEKPLSH